MAAWQHGWNENVVREISRQVKVKVKVEVKVRVNMRNRPAFQLTIGRDSGAHLNGDNHTP